MKKRAASPFLVLLLVTLTAGADAPPPVAPARPARPAWQHASPETQALWQRHKDALTILDISEEAKRQVVIAQGTPEAYHAHPTTALSELELSYANITCLRNQDRRKVETDESLIMAQLDAVEAIHINQDIMSVFDRFKMDRERTFFPVVDQVGFPVGLIHERAF